MKKLNFGCGDRIAEGWINIDFNAHDSRVRRVNLLKGFPYCDNHFDVVYSSHVLEHFTREQALFLLGESRRVLKPNGTLRIVVPSLEGTCREYLRILGLADSDTHKGPQYEWIVIELLDQLVRSFPSGEMGAFFQKLRETGNKKLFEYVCSRTESNMPWSVPSQTVPTFLDKLGKMNLQQALTKFDYLYLRFVGHLIPAHLRSMVFVETSVGERHRWMYDIYGLKRLCEKAGFVGCRSLPYNESSLSGFHEEHLDSNNDGTQYKNNSIYLEAVKPA